MQLASVRSGDISCLTVLARICQSVLSCVGLTTRLRLVPAGRAGCAQLASQPNASKATRTLNKTQKYRFPTWNPRAVLLRITNALSGTLGNLVSCLSVKHAGRSCFSYANFIAGFSRTLPDKTLTMPFKSVKNAIFQQPIHGTI